VYVCNVYAPKLLLFSKFNKNHNIVTGILMKQHTQTDTTAASLWLPRVATKATPE
jgi:hypothetical protein